MLVPVMGVVWKLVASLLFLVAVHRGDVSAVVAEPEGKQPLLA